MEDLDVGDQCFEILKILGGEVSEAGPHLRRRSCRISGTIPRMFSVVDVALSVWGLYCGVYCMSHILFLAMPMSYMFLVL